MKVENIQINLDTLAGDALDSKNNTRPLSMENDFIPELLNDSKNSKKRRNMLENPPPLISKNISSTNVPAKKSSNNFTNDFSQKSNTEYEKRNNGSYFGDKSNEHFISNESLELSKNTEEDTMERARRIAQAKGNQFSEDSQRKALYTYGADSSKRWDYFINLTKEIR